MVAAHTVFMVEPVFNEALEQQAISRVDRIGQTKEVGNARLILDIIVTELSNIAERPPFFGTLSVTQSRNECTKFTMLNVIIEMNSQKRLRNQQIVKKLKFYLYMLPWTNCRLEGVKLYQTRISTTVLRNT